MNTILEKPLYVVGIGASAGGLDAIQQLFDKIPSDTGMAFVIIQHLSPDFKSLMPELLAKHTEMPIFTAEDKQKIQPNCIYLNPRNKNLHIKDFELYLLDKGPKHNLNLPIDIFFHTLGEEHLDKAVGVIFSGTGSDGSRGIRTIKEGGGTIIVQEPTSAQFDGMPNSAIATTLVDFILPPAEIAEILTKIPTNKPLFVNESNVSVNKDSTFNNILLEVYNFSGIDFREYKQNTLIRRLEKRISIKNLNNLEEYAQLLSSNSEEKKILRDDFLIGVTRFFRDADAFKILKEQTIPSICKSKKNNETIRIWVPGCSTGEEVYSIAILFDDYIRSEKLGIEFKIFATDIDPRGLTIASSGSYHINIINEIEKYYLDQYFVKVGEKLQVINRIREKIVFSNHNLIKDPPFIRLDLISCRNLLIYLDNKIQRKVMSAFQFSLNKYGFLFLGSSETLGDFAKFYKTIDIKWRFFQNITNTVVPSSQREYSSQSMHNYPSTLNTIKRSEYKLKEHPEYIFYRYLSKRNSPSSIFIDADFNLLFIVGDAGKKISIGEGMFQSNLLKMLDVEIGSIIRNGIRQVNQKKTDLLIKNIEKKTENERYKFDLTFHKVGSIGNQENVYLIQFSDDRIEEIPTSEISVVENEDYYHRIEDLEFELKSAKLELQNAIEELETSNEELQSSNEELMASNEELQSTNEELQSVNEELYTVNSEMQDKNKELTQLNNDITNLLNNTEIATIFLDTDLKIRKFTPKFEALFNLNEVDYGRAISSFTSNFSDKNRNSIIADAQKVLDKLVTIEKEVVDIQGNFYLNRISPFITSDKKIDGVVITLDNINQLKTTKNELAITETKYHKLFENLNEGFVHAKIITDSSNNVVDWEYIDVNPAYEKQIGIKMDELRSKKASQFFENLSYNNIDWLSVFGKSALTGEDQFLEYQTTKDYKHYYVHVFSPNMGEFAATFADITELKKNQRLVEEREKELKRIQGITKVGSWYLDLETKDVTWSPELYRIYGFDSSQPPPPFAEHYKLFTKESWEILSVAIDKVKFEGTPYNLELELINSEKKKGWLWVQGEALEDNDGNTIATRGAAQDITDRKNIEDELRAAKQIAIEANLQKNYFLANMSHEIRTPMNAVLGFSELLRISDLTKEQQNTYLKIIDGNAKQLLNIIDDIIDVAKIESGKLKVTLSDCNIGKMIRSLEVNFNQIKFSRGENNIEIKSIVPSEYENLMVKTDELRVIQVLTNLIGNALKFTQRGSITYGFDVKDNEVQFFVEDTGIGMQMEKLDEIFERFKQLHLNKEAVNSGTGLGLAICKGLVELLGGEISVVSELEKGSRFTFTIPYKNGQDNRSDEVPNEITNFDLNGKTILVADDESSVQFYYKEVYKDTGANVIIASNGFEAIELYKKHKEIDVVLLDIRMPIMNGRDAIGEILKINPNAKIIMQSAFAMPEDKEACFNAGCIDYLVKPVNPLKLTSIFQNLS